MSHEPFPPEELLVTERFRVLRHTQLLDDGRVRRRETIQHPGAVVILPWFSQERALGLIRNYRVAVGQAMWELPAGTLDPGETPLQNALRELREETGYRVESLLPMGELFMSPGILNERMHLFVACDPVAGETALEAGEEIENHRISWTEALAMIDDGRICDAKTVAAILLWDRRLRS